MIAYEVRAVCVGTPRVVERICVKRNEPLTWRSYGHWWVEIGDESYGWWPSRLPARLRDVFGGCDGVLNAVHVPELGGTDTRDPHHGLPGDHEFHPVLVVPKTDSELIEGIRTFAQRFSGGWRWSTRPTMNCRMFQLAMFDAVGLVDGTGNYRTRGPGCPALAPLRRVAFSTTGQRFWPGNLPRPGQRVNETLPNDRG